MIPSLLKAVGHMIEEYGCLLVFLRIFFAIAILCLTAYFTL